jgi:predicted nucleic acid-binding protein
MIVDASVAIKWLFVEEQSDLAGRLLTKIGLIAPDLLLCEVANSVWKKWRKGEVKSVPSRLSQLSEFFEEIVPAADLSLRAAEIALELDHPAYDCFYLALAEMRELVVITSDERLMNKLRGGPHAHLVLPLSEAVEL